MSLWVSESIHGPLRGVRRARAALCLAQTQTLIFTARCYGDSSSRLWSPRLKEPDVERDSLTPQEGHSTAKLSLPILNRHTIGVGPAYSTSPPRQPILTWILSYILRELLLN